MRIQLKLRNEMSQGLVIDITDRVTEIKTTSLATNPNVIPPLGVLSTYIDEGEIIVWTANGIKIEKEKNDDTE